MIDDMFTEEEKQAALDQAYRFLAQRFLSSYELRQKMKRKQISSDLIDYVIVLIENPLFFRKFIIFLRGISL